MLLYLTDNRHKGSRIGNTWNGLTIAEENVELGCIKTAEKEDALILRLFETEGKQTAGQLTISGQEYAYRIAPYEILTLKISRDGSVKEVNMLER